MRILTYNCYRPRSNRKMALVLIFILVVAISLSWQAILQTLELVVVQRRCATYQLDAQRVVYWFNSDRATARSNFLADTAFQPLSADLREGTIDVECWRRLCLK